MGIFRYLNPLAWLEQKALFTPERSFRGNPEHVGLEYSDIFPVTDDGVKLHAWHMPVVSPDSEENAVWLILHGNGGNISVRLDQYQEIHRRYKAPIIAFDYRGYGKSEGTPSENGFYADALAAFRATRQLYPNSKIVVFGRSLGGAIAANLASKVAPDALILEASISSIKEAILERVYRWVFPLIRLLVVSEFPTKKFVAVTEVPKLILHGDSDKTVSSEHSVRIYNAASEPKQLEIIENGDHDGLDLVDPETYHAVVRDFLRIHGAL